MPVHTRRAPDRARSNRRRAAGLVVAALMSLPVASSHSQQNPTRVSARPSCSTCSIAITDTFSIGKPTDPILLQFSTRFALTSQNVLATGAGDSPVAVFDRAGRFITGFGRLGNGPGEMRFGNPWLARTLADSLYAVTGRNVMLFSPTRTYVRSFTIPANYHFVVLGNGRLVVSGTIFRDSTQTTFPIHLLSPSGALERSFGSIARVPTRCSWCVLFAVASGANNSVWTMAPQRQELTRWDLNGRLLEHIALSDSPWFREWDAELQSTAPGRVTRVMDMTYDNGILWIRSALPLIQTARGVPGMGIAANSVAPFADGASVLEAYDVNRREIVASARYDRQDVRMLPGGVAALLRQDSAGFVRFMIGKLVVRGR